MANAGRVTLTGLVSEADPELARGVFHFVEGWVIFAVALVLLIVWSYRGAYDAQWHSHIELTGLYWHFVDIAWIFIFPLLYLIGRHVG